MILLVFLGFFSLFDLLWILPLARDVGVNLLTDAIFTIFTIVFLSWMIRIRDHKAWKSIEERVTDKLRDCLKNLFENLVGMSSIAEKYSSSDKSLDEVAERVYLNGLGSLHRRIALT